MMNITAQNKLIYQRVARMSSQIVTRNYSTSFSLSIYLLDKSIRNAIYAIYGFVRLADEIVDTFTDHGGAELLANFKTETYRALNSGISMNPILHNFQETAHCFDIDRELTEAFFNSMEMDLKFQSYQRKSFDAYIFGSAEVVGLMCLKVFCDKDAGLYRELKPHAQRLGAAFQKVNFLRDINQDTQELYRYYFPQLQNGKMNLDTKIQIEKEIDHEFGVAYEGIRKLPAKARLGVYAAYVYYRSLHKKLKRVPPEKLYSTRVRLSGSMKSYLLLKTVVRYTLNGI